jgi:molybdopterin-guanine dinucleotide biosynthesis protein A
MSEFAAVVLAGGAARRLGGAAKPELRVAGVALLTRVLRAVPTADPIVVVGPPSLAPLLPPRVRLTREDPPGGGPVPAAQAGAALLTRTDAVVALLAADLPFLTPATVAHLAAELDEEIDGAVLVDDGGQAQWLCGVWRVGPLVDRLAAASPNASLRAALGDLRITRVASPASGAPAWFDCDTDADLQTAEEWAHADPG